MQVNIMLNRYKKEEIKSIIKSEPLLFLNANLLNCDEEDSHIFSIDKLKLCELKNSNYLVIVECVYETDLSYLSYGAHETIPYDYSYPVYEEFDSKSEAECFYDTMSNLLRPLKISLKAKRLYFKDRRYDYEGGNNQVRVYNNKMYKKDLVVFNKYQNISVHIMRVRNVFGEEKVYINNQIQVSFEDKESADKFYDNLVEFYNGIETIIHDIRYDNKFITEYLDIDLKNSLYKNSRVSDYKIRYDSRGILSQLEVRGETKNHESYTIKYNMAARNNLYWSHHFIIRAHLPNVNWGYEEYKGTNCLSRLKEQIEDCMMERGG